MLLPYPISTNRYWRNFRGMMVRSAEATAYKEVVEEIARKSKQEMFNGPVCVEMTLHPPAPKDWEKRQKKDIQWALKVRRMDLDNAQKVAIDALQGIAYENDRQITSLSIELGQPFYPDGGLVVIVSEDVCWGIPA